MTSSAMRLLDSLNFRILPA